MVQVIILIDLKKLFMSVLHKNVQDRFWISVDLILLFKPN